IGVGRGLAAQSDLDMVA
ncbi:hypothetical protein SEEHN189_04026, partial [Salmonella enterica subsp. enterica serovar Heidelberg str. N189]